MPCLSLFFGDLSAVALAKAEAWVDFTSGRANIKGMVINDNLLAAAFISLAAATATLSAIAVMLRRQRRRLQKSIADFAQQNVTMARRLTEIMLNQQKKQEAHEEALEKVVGYAMKMRREINLLAVRALEDEDDDFTTSLDDDAKRLLN